MKSALSSQHRYALKLLAFAFLLGSAFQLGISTASHFKPRIEVVEVHHQVKTSPGVIKQSIEF